MTAVTLWRANGTDAPTPFKQLTIPGDPHHFGNPHECNAILAALDQAYGLKPDDLVEMRGARPAPEGQPPRPERSIYIGRAPVPGTDRVLWRRLRRDQLPAGVAREVEG